MKGLRRRAGAWLAGAALLLLASPALAGGDINLQDYYPLQDGNSWTYQFRSHQPDGQVRHSIKTYRVDGELELENGARPKKLVDQRGWYYLLTVESDRYLHFGEHEDQGLVTNEPPFTFFDTRNVFGKVYQSAHTISSGGAHGAEVIFDGYESVKVPAGEFKDCLKSSFKYIRENGSTFVSITYLARGVGPVKKEFAIYSPKAGQTLSFERELLHATVNGQPVGGKAAPTVADLGTYFPYFQADSWTYDWTYVMADGTQRSEERTRSFAGSDFFNATAAYKLLDNKGSYQYWTYHPERGVEMHQSFENRPGGSVLTYEPAVLVARPDMVIGRVYRWSEVSAEQPEGIGRYKRLTQWTSSLEGYQTLETPMGIFEVLRARLSWETSKGRSEQTYYLAKNVGIVGADYEAIDPITGKRVIALNARVKHAKLRGDEVASLADLAKHVEHVAAANAALVDEPEARKIFRAASENRYVWVDGFPGLKAEVELIDHGGEPVHAKVDIDPNLMVDFDCETCSGELRALARAQISQFVTHRLYESFDDKYGPGKAYFRLLKQRDDGTAEIRVDGDTAMGSWYLIDGKQVRKLTRTLGGPIEFMIHHEKNIITEDGKYIANFYPVTFFMRQGDQKIPLGKVVYDDVFEKKGKWWLPKHRKLKGKMPQPDKSVLDIDLEVRFTDVQYAGGAEIASGP